MCASLFAQSAGEKAYENGNFAGARENFLSAANLGYGANAYHNAANACVKLGRQGEAMLNYKRAKYLNPRAPETAANIEMLEKSLGIPKSRENFSDSFFGELSNYEWAVAACASFWAALFALAIPPLFGRRKSSHRFLGAGFSCVCAVSVAGMIYWSEFRNSVVSTGPDAMLKLSPAENAPAVAALSEGKSAIIRKEHNGYMFLQTKDGKLGWAKPGTIQKIVE